MDSEKYRALSSIFKQTICEKYEECVENLEDYALNIKKYVENMKDHEGNMKEYEQIWKKYVEELDMKKYVENIWRRVRNMCKIRRILSSPLLNSLSLSIKAMGLGKIPSSSSPCRL